MRRKTIGVIVGRFQVPELTDGHFELIEHVKQRSDDVCVLVGVSATRDMRNPLTFDMVAQVIRDDFPGLFHVHPLEDLPGYDAQWSVRIDLFLGLLFPRCDIKLYGGRNSFKPHYGGRHRPVVEVPTFDTSTSGTRVRSEIVNDKPEETVSFRKGVIYAVGNYVQTSVPSSNGQLQSLPLEATTQRDDLHL